MLRNDLLRADFGSGVKRNFMVEPRGVDHARFVALNIAERARHDVADAVNHAYGKRCVVGQMHFHGIFGNEFRFGGHDGAPRRGLRHLVYRAVMHSALFNVWQDQRIHKAFDKGGFSRAYGTDDADVYIALCAFGNVIVNASFFHFDVPPQTLGISSLHLVSTASPVSLFSAVMASAVVLYRRAISQTLSPSCAK